MRVWGPAGRPAGGDSKVVRSRSPAGTIRHVVWGIKKLKKPWPLDHSNALANSQPTMMRWFNQKEKARNYYYHTSPVSQPRRQVETKS
ncbi:unnamed protein product [Linum trigynum]|uniref:Uncharacterized protein n=1 Tax=Linum trigynum TaxID=586398 RepID=A0AAV2EYY0_9ROSI